VTAPEAIRRELVAGWADYRAFARRCTRSLADAEDVLQTWALKALARAPRTALRDPRAWLYRVLRNTLIDHARGASARQRALSALAEEWPSMAIRTDPGQPCGCVERALDELPAGQAELVRWATLDGEPQATIARRLGTSVGTVAVRLHRARRRLERRLAVLCGNCCPRSAYACSCEAPAAASIAGCKNPPARSSAEKNGNSDIGQGALKASLSPAPADRDPRRGVR
jgi:DNA-directed RNA polymerase specialized sigma24 family protein